MSASCSVSLSSPQHWSPLRDLWSPGADPQPNYVGGAQLDCVPIHLPHSTQAQEQRGNFSFFHHCKCWVLSRPQITWGDRVEVFTQAAELELDIRAADKMFSQHATRLSSKLNGWVFLFMFKMDQTQVFALFESPLKKRMTISVPKHHLSDEGSSSYCHKVTEFTEDEGHTQRTPCSFPLSSCFALTVTTIIHYPYWPICWHW